MTTQPRALALADALDAGSNFYAESSLWYDEKLANAAGNAAAELRRLSALNAQLREALKDALPQIVGPRYIKARAAIKAAEAE